MRFTHFPARTSPALALLLVVSCGSPRARQEDTVAATHAAHGATNDSAFAAVQTRGAGVMGVDQYSSTHVFESLPDGGRIILERPSASDSLAVETIRAHMREIASAFGRGDFTAPGLVHAQRVPGTQVMAARVAALRYEAVDRPRGAEVRITTNDPEALAAVHDFLAFQRADHRASGHEGSHGHAGATDTRHWRSARHRGRGAGAPGDTGNHLAKSWPSWRFLNPSMPAARRYLTPQACRPTTTAALSSASCANV